MLHATHNATRKIDMDDDLTMLIGPGTVGHMLEVGILDMDGDDPSRHPRDAIRRKFYPFLA